MEYQYSSNSIQHEKHYGTFDNCDVENIHEITIFLQFYSTCKALWNIWSFQMKTTLMLIQDSAIAQIMPESGFPYLLQKQYEPG